MACRRRTRAVLTALLALASILPAPAAPAQARVSARSVARGMWSDPATWGGEMPGRGDTVLIASGSHVVLDTSTPALGGLQVDGTLSFAPKDLELTSDWIVVHGRLRVGTAKKPFRGNAVITLTGAPSDQDVMGMGTKLLGVMGGTLDLHGRRVRTWARLDGTAGRGAERVTLDTDVPWGPGDRIALASSDYWRQHDEVRTITAVSGRTLQLDSPLDYRHWGEVQTFDGHAVDERAEVALLTHNVIVRGDETSDHDGFGGHLMVMEGSTARIEGVELARMGQRKALRRYPVHFHMDGEAPGSYLKRSTIHDSFNRCVVVHGTHDLVVRDNVCFDHAGHGFFLEDGIETRNVIAGNLGFGTRKVENGLLPSDARPATFWITNPDNVLRGNVAAGSDGFGFWYALPRHPTGLSEDSDVWPRRTPLGEFSDNVAHSNAQSGLNVDDGPRPGGDTESASYDPVADPSDPESEPVEARFEGLVAYMNRSRGVWLRGSHLVVSDAILADNRAGATFAASETYLERTVVVAETHNPGMVEPWEDTGPTGRALPVFWDPDAPIGGFEFYDGKVGVRDTTFVGFRPNSLRQAGGLTYLAPNAFSLDPHNFAERVRFVDSNPVYLTEPEPRMDGDVSKVFYDRDGTVTGRPGSAVVVNNPFLLDDTCEYRAAWNAHVCDSDYVSLLAGSPGGGRSRVDPLIVRRADGVEQRLVGCCDYSDEAYTTLVPGRSYEVEFNGEVPNEAKLVLFNGRGRWIRVSMVVSGPVRVTRWGRALQQVAGLDALGNRSDSGWHYDAATSTVHVKLYGHGDWEEVRIQT
ncbi:MAG: transmembrane domain-containing protein [Actinomycetota bacterium]|nr:transmembrane domain-containing protein [Actinomycetota bacterium]